MHAPKRFLNWWAAAGPLARRLHPEAGPTRMRNVRA